MAAVLAGAALCQGAARAEVRVDTQACPLLDSERLRHQIDVELSASTNAPSPGEMDLNVSCTPDRVHIAMPRERLSRDIPLPDVSDSDKERTVAIAAVQTVVTVIAVPPRLAPPALTVAPGLGLQLALTFIGWEAGARGWWPLSDHTALVAAPSFEWAYAGAGSAHVDRYKLEVSFAYRRPPLPGLPQGELHLFVIPAYSSPKDLGPGDPPPTIWSVTPGFGFGVWMHAGRVLIGAFTDYGWSVPKNQWPRDLGLYSHLWFRTSVTVALERPAHPHSSP